MEYSHHQLKGLCRLGILLALSNLTEVASVTESLVKFNMLSLVWPIVTLNLALNKIQSRSVLSSFGVVLMSCRVNFHVLRSALQHSACRI